MKEWNQRPCLGDPSARRRGHCTWGWVGRSCVVAVVESQSVPVLPADHMRLPWVLDPAPRPRPHTSNGLQLVDVVVLVGKRVEPARGLGSEWGTNYSILDVKPGT